MDSFSFDGPPEYRATVEQIIGDLPEPEQRAFAPETLPGSPPLPEPGIYFGMPDEVYHAIPALSNSGIKKLAASPMMFWASTPWLSAKKQREAADSERAHHVLGKAYHCRIMEGADQFAKRFAVGLDPADYPDALESTDQIKAAIVAAGEKPASKVPDKMPDGADYMRAARKDDWIDQLLDADPEAQIFSRLAAAHRETHAGKTMLTAEQFAELEIAARMIERDPEVSHAFKGGHAEVTLLWVCERTGVPMKARVDYLKVKAMVDLKSISNQREKSIENAIRYEIAAYHYNIQPAVYSEAAEALRALVRKHGASVIHVDDDYPYPADETVAWALKWAKHRDGDEWLWVFQQKGDAPITRALFYPLTGTTNMVTKDIVTTAKKRFRKCSEGFGTEPWLDVAPIYTIADEDIPQFATEI